MRDILHARHADVPDSEQRERLSGNGAVRLTGVKGVSPPCCQGFSFHCSSKKFASTTLPGQMAFGGVLRSMMAQSGSMGT